MFPVSTPSVRVIIADDHEWILNILTQVVRDTLPAGRWSLSRMAKRLSMPTARTDAIFLVSDHLMPHLDGPTLVRSVRALAPGLPIVMVSAKPDVRAEALAAGANWFLAKDQITEHLPRLLREYIHGQKPPAAGE